MPLPILRPVRPILTNLGNSFSHPSRASEQIGRRDLTSSQVRWINHQTQPSLITNLPSRKFVLYTTMSLWCHGYNSAKSQVSGQFRKKDWSREQALSPRSLSTVYTNTVYEGLVTNACPNDVTLIECHTSAFRTNSAMICIICMGHNVQNHINNIYKFLSISKFALHWPYLCKSLPIDQLCVCHVAYLPTFQNKKAVGLSEFHHYFAEIRAKLVISGCNRLHIMYFYIDVCIWIEVY